MIMRRIILTLFTASIMVMIGQANLFAQSSPTNTTKTVDVNSLKSSNWLTEKYANDKLPGPSIGARGGYYASEKHTFIVEEWANVPLFREGNFMVSYSYDTFTPFQKENGVHQVARNDMTQELNLEYDLNEQIALMGGFGWEQSDFIDATGDYTAYRVGVGAGTPYVKRYTDKLTWSFIAGPAFGVDNAQANWFMDIYGSYQIFDFNYLASTKNLAKRPSLNIEARMESYNMDLTRFGPYVNVGPTLSFISANGNKLDFFAHYVGNGGNQFKMTNDQGAYLGFAVNAMREYPFGTLPTDWQNGDVLPKVWGYYEMGWGRSGDYVTNFKINAQLYQFRVGIPWTAYVWFQPRRYWAGGKNDVSSALYNVGFGLMTPITLDNGWDVIGNRMPMQLGFEFFHRSDHSINPSATQVANNNKGPNNSSRYAWQGSMNQFPRVFFSTAGWDSPYVYTEMYKEKLAWVNTLDWRTSIGYTVESANVRAKSPISAEIGIQWNIVTVYGYVPYVRGGAGYGAVSPGYMGEVGFQRPAYKMYIRYENENLSSVISGGRDNVWYGGFSLNL